MIKIPTKAEGLTTVLEPDEVKAITYYVVFKTTKSEAFRRFVRPDLATKSTLDKYAKAFFDDRRVKDYIAQYEQTLENALNPKQLDEEINEDDLSDKKKKVVSNFVKYILNQMDNIELVEDPELVLKMADKAGLLDEEEVKTESPRRYLPELCSNCRYKLFCEEECEDECTICRYKEFANEKGVYYDHKSQLKK